MPNVFKFAAVKTSNDLQKELHNISVEPGYAWIEPIIKITTDEYVKSQLPPAVSKSRYAPWRVEDNINEAGYILDNSLAKLREIQDLEAEAIRSALDIQFAQQIQSIEFELRKVELEAQRKQADLQNGDGTADIDTLMERETLINDARQTRLNHHLIEGGSLNYGERVSELRKLLADNIEKAYERLYAVWMGLRASFGIQVDEPPGWDGPHALTKLIIWLRNASRKLDEGRRSESIYDVYFHLGADAISDISAVRLAGKAIVRFTLKPENFPGWAIGKSIRILRLGATLVFNDLSKRFSDAMAADPPTREIFNSAYGYSSKQRESLSVSLRIDLPEQIAELPALSAMEKRWTLEPVRLTGVPVWSHRSLLESVALYGEPQYMNAVPIGEWEIEIPAMIDSTAGRLPREKAGAGVSLDVPALTDYLAPKDVVLALRLAVR